MRNCAFRFLLSKVTVEHKQLLTRIVALQNKQFDERSYEKGLDR
jgi:hypothetical protein